MVKRRSKRSKVSRKSKRLKKTKMIKRNYKKRTIKRTRRSQRGGWRWRRNPYNPVMNDDDELTDDRGGWWRRMRRNRMVPNPEPEYFPSLNWVKMKYGLKKGWKMLDEDSIDRLKHCLNNSHERIKIFTKSVSKRGYLYTTRDSLLPHEGYFEKTEEYRGLIDSLPVEEVDESLDEFINKKYTEVMTEINLDISPLKEIRLNYSQSAKSTFTIFRNSEHIILVKREAGGVPADREILGSIVGFILGISPELYYFGKLNYDSQEYMYLIFRAYNSIPGRFRGRVPGADHGVHSDHEFGRRNLVKDNSTGKWYFIDMGQFEFDQDLYMIYE